MGTAVLPRTSAHHFKTKRSDGILRPGEAFWLPTAKNSEMGSKIGALLHGQLSTLAGRGCLPVRKGLRPFSGLQRTPHLSLGL